MEVKQNVSTLSISWLSGSCSNATGIVSNFFIPETVEELTALCDGLNRNGEKYILVGHTSNIYFAPEYSVSNIITTRRINHWNQSGCIIDCECGVSVSKLAKDMVDKGIMGYDGLIDLPGTVGAAIYGASSCYGCSVVDLLIDFQLLKPDGSIETIQKESLMISHHSTALKEGLLKGIILRARLMAEKGDINEIMRKADYNHKERMLTQPGPRNNLGSIFKNQGKLTTPFLLLFTTLKALELVLSLFYKKEKVKEIKKKLLFKILKAEDLLPYVYDWNRFIWKDNVSHSLFWKYVDIHKRVFKSSEFEIEIYK